MRTRFFILMMTLCLPLAAGAQATMKPLVIIRFNQDTIRYDQQLYGAIAQAVNIKPDVMFDLVAYAPQTGNGSTDSQWQQTAARDAQNVMASMQKMGVPASRMRLIAQAQPGLHYDETHVYAR